MYLTVTQIIWCPLTLAYQLDMGSFQMMCSFEGSKSEQGIHDTLTAQVGQNRIHEHIHLGCLIPQGSNDQEYKAQQSLVVREMISLNHKTAFIAQFSLSDSILEEDITI